MTSFRSLLGAAVVGTALAGIAPGHGATADDPAFAVAKALGRGVNILGYDGLWDGGVDAPFRQRFFGDIRSAGFSHVRINLHAFKYMDAENRIDPVVLQHLDWALDRAIEADLIPVLDEHDFAACQSDPEDCKPRIEAFWTAIAGRYAGRYPSLVFELLNEPGGAMSSAWWNRALAGLLAIVREKNPDRTVIVAALNAGGPSAACDLRLPADDRNIIITAHYYEPMLFTHQGAAWSKRYGWLRDIPWGSEADRARVRTDLEQIGRCAAEQGRPLYLGEFGVYDAAPMESRARYLAFVARTAEAFGWSWAYWQFDHDFALFDLATGHWIVPVLEALVPGSSKDVASAAAPTPPEERASQ